MRCIDAIACRLVSSTPVVYKRNCLTAGVTVTATGPAGCAQLMLRTASVIGCPETLNIASSTGWRRLVMIEFVQVMAPYAFRRFSVTVDANADKVAAG